MEEMHLNDFQAIGLPELEEVGLLNRVDHKYSVAKEQLLVLLERLKEDYYCLEIDGKRVFFYTNTYYDTKDDVMYNDHLRGKSNRYKVRIRAYDSSELQYLEIKRKDNKGRTRKLRMGQSGSVNIQDAKARDFILEHSPFNPDDLRPVIHSSFERITLVNKNMEERCTIDLNIKLKQGKKVQELSHIAIVEVKTMGHNKASRIFRELRSLKNTRDGFSKYCIGRSMLDEEVKNNRYRAKIRSVEKQEQMD